MNTRPYSDELTHYGVLGMKWGVRRTPEQLGRRFSKKKYDFDIDTDKRFRKESDGSYTLKSGTVVQRVSDTKEKSARSTTYVSLTKRDNEIYAINFNETLKIDNPKTKVYINSYKTKNDIRIPSKETCQDIFVKMYKDAPKYLADKLGTGRKLADIAYYGTKTMQRAFGNKKYEYGQYDSASNKRAKKTNQLINEFYKGRYSKMTVSQLKDDAFYDFFGRLAYSDTPESQYFIRRIKQMGYTGLIDYNDQSGLGSRSDLKSRPTPQAPLIILDGENALSKRNTRRVNIPYNDGGSYFWNKADKNSPDYIDTRKQYSEWLKEQRSR